MSAKRAAPTELNHDNWDQDDPSEHEEMGTFKTASKDILEKRVIRTAKRRAPISGDEGKKGVFSGFGGFNKSQPSSFDFLANLTNGNKMNSPISKSDTAVTSSLFSSKPLSSSPGSGIFASQVSSTPTKSTFGVATSQSSTLFGTNTQAATSLFSASKADSTVGDSPFKAQPVSSSNEAIGTNSTKTTNAVSNPSGSQVTSTIFGAPNLTGNVSKSLFSNTNNTPFKMQNVSSSTTMQNTFGTSSTSNVAKPNESAEKKENSNEDKKIIYYSKLKGLNESVSAWIKKHVEETPLCILTPIFRDYEKYLKEMQNEYHGSDEEVKQNKNSTATAMDSKSSGTDSNKTTQSIPAFTATNLNVSSPSTKIETSPNSKLPAFGSPTNSLSLGEKSKFSFGINTSASSGTATTSASFSFGISTTESTVTAVSSPFSTTAGINSTASPFSAATTNTNGTAAPFSFGIGKPFSFNSNIQKPATETTENGKEDDDKPPKVDFTPVVEENSVYDKRCKIFVKKDTNFVDKGVGTLYIKKVEESGKHQLLVRANTNLGNILVNLILASAIPTQRMGKNNVMLVCIPTPDAKPPPTPILIRVKTSEEADELLETLNKYKT